ncbi:NADH:ubiquinone oxidoreductase subunit H [Candidatus Methylomirabilis lanthanidiphila]|uniref:NADH-quinone oxidoreductase subunit H n=1 Tax=Candidatus Methylomirabilis lanthanidiphila TaxID=2211376 RepID=A0A564ZFB2_9BACT|nr:NADH-quinone oxidoreductase subunit NuoH [Candidatus Methylomirabilis lanthanidiphila]VUZ84025.1 NADH:ubiquinone oxidoreductase subunit H [Candidatus Methylomirabilis lanthanidiphila]
MPDGAFFVIMVTKIVVVFGLMLLSVTYLTWLERKVIGDIQVRLGPMRVGPHGLLQPIADGIKLLFKEDIVPQAADRVLYLLAPVVALIPAFISFAVIPFGDHIRLFGQTIDLVITDVNIGLLYVFGVASLGVYGIVLGGWASNNKYALLGGLRASAQMISYELSLGLSVIGVVMLSQSLSLVEIVGAQARTWFILLQPVGFLIFLICAVAETNRAPFDLPEAETELVAGFHVEYSSMKFAMYFMAEYANMITVSAMATTLFLGGWRGPWLPPVVWFLVKLYLLIFLFIWLRGTLPRFRYDQLMRFGWKVLLPVALVNIMITAVFVALR